MAAIPWILTAVLWTPLAFAGGLGFAPLIGVVGLWGVFLKKEWSIRPYMAILLIALVFASVSSLWSPYKTPIMEIDVAEGVFNVKAAVVRIGLVALFAAFAIAAAYRLAPHRARWISYLFIGAFLLQFIAYFATANFTMEIYEVFKGYVSDHGSAYQDAARNGVILCVVAIIVAGFLKSARKTLGIFRHVAAASVCISCILLLGKLSNSAGVVAMSAGFVALYIPNVIRRNTFIVLSQFSALLVLLAPLLCGVFIHILGDRKYELAPSFLWRVEAWDEVISKISQKPLFGWGLDALRTFDATFTTGRWEGELIVPMHAHNMFLHLWAECGYLGAVLVALALVLVGRRLSRAVGSCSPGALSAACGLWIVCLTICSFSFSLWNVWWWAVVGLAIAILIILDIGWREVEL